MAVQRRTKGKFLCCLQRHKAGTNSEQAEYYKYQIEKFACAHASTHANTNTHTQRPPQPLARLRSHAHTHTHAHTHSPTHSHAHSLTFIHLHLVVTLSTRQSRGYHENAHPPPTPLTCSIYFMHQQYNVR